MANEGQTQDSCSCLFVSGLVKIKEANDIEEKLNEVERLLKNAINMPCKVGPSAVTLQTRHISVLYQLNRCALEDSHDASSLGLKVDVGKLTTMYINELHSTPGQRLC